MIRSQMQKLVSITPPAAKVDAGSFTTAAIDTAGFDYCTIYCFLGDTDIAMAALKVQESDASNMSNAADIVGTRVGTDADISGSTSSLPGAGDDNKFVAFEIDLRGRKRYLDLVATAGDGSTGTYLTAWAVLERAEESPKNAATRGCLLVMRVP